MREKGGAVGDRPNGMIAVEGCHGGTGQAIATEFSQGEETVMHNRFQFTLVLRRSSDIASCCR